jgi:hypothetical protein
MPRNRSDEEYLVHMRAAFGRCTCLPDDCDEEGDPGCALCQALDPEWACPAEDSFLRRWVEENVLRADEPCVCGSEFTCLASAHTDGSLDAQD